MGYHGNLVTANNVNPRIMIWLFKKSYSRSTTKTITQRPSGSDAFIADCEQAFGY